MSTASDVKMFCIFHDHTLSHIGAWQTGNISGVSLSPTGLPQRSPICTCSSAPAAQSIEHKDNPKHELNTPPSAGTYSALARYLHSHADKNVARLSGLIALTPQHAEQQYTKHGIFHDPHPSLPGGKLVLTLPFELTTTSDDFDPSSESDRTLNSASSLIVANASRNANQL